MNSPGNPAMELQERAQLTFDGYFRRTFTMPLKDARAKAREIIRELPSDGLMSIVEEWWQMPDGQIQFTMRRLPTTDEIETGRRG
jgi:hypothetical protein